MTVCSHSTKGADCTSLGEVIDPFGIYPFLSGVQGVPTLSLHCCQGDGVPYLSFSPPQGVEVESLSCSLVIMPAIILTFPFFLFFLFFFFSLFAISWSAICCGHAAYLMILGPAICSITQYCLLWLHIGNHSHVP